MTLSLEGRYLRYVRDCAAWALPALSFEEFRAYWELFARDGELGTSQTPNVPVGTQAPILVQERPAKPGGFAGHYQQASGGRL